MDVKKALFIAGGVFILAYPLIRYKHNHQSEKHFSFFDNLEGPLTKTNISPEAPTRISEFEKGSTSRMAVLVTDENSRWQDLIKGFKSIGIPFVVTKDYKEAIKHKVIFVYPYISGRSLSTEALDALKSHPTNGGTLMAVNVLGGGLQDTFGFENVKEGENHKEMRFSPSFSNVISPDVQNIDPKESYIQLAKNKEKSILISTSYSQPRLAPLALYEDKSVAITQNSVGRGHAYAFGIDLGQLFFIGFSAREEDMARTYVNHYEPTIDVFLRFIKAAYQSGEPNAVTVDVVPDGKELAILLSHDIDYSESVTNSLEYSQLEKDNNVEATYFLQVKYLKDFNDKIFFDQKNIDEINIVKAHRMEIGSHSISHSRQYNKFPLGDGLEKYPDYKPFVVDRLTTKDGSVLGELRVSKFLIEKKTTQKEVISFRPGELSYPYALPQALLATGFKYSSSATANNCLTHLPFQLSFNRESKQMLPIFEFPVTIEDEEYSDMTKQVPDALQVSEAISQYGGIFVVLIHPNVTEHKLEFEKQIITYWKDRAWFGTIGNYGDWWQTRNSLEVDATDNEITLKSPQSIKGLTIDIPRGKKIISINPNSVTFNEIKNSVTLGEFQGEIKISLQK